MKERESIEEIFTRFSKIIGNIKAFGKPYSSGDQVRKILKSLPTTWQTKVVALESQDLNKLSYDEVPGDLIAFEKTHLKRTNQGEKKKTIAFKTTTEGPEDDIDDDAKALEEEIAMVSRNKNGLMRRYRNKKKGRMSSRELGNIKNNTKIMGNALNVEGMAMFKLNALNLKEKSPEDSTKTNTSEVGVMKTVQNMRNILAAGLMKTHQMMKAKKILKIVSWHEVKQAREKKDWEHNFEVYEIERDLLQDEVQELQMQLNGMRKSTTHSSVKSNQANYKSTEKGPARTESTKYPQKFIIGDPSEGMKTRGALKKKANVARISQIKPKKVEKALKDSNWVQAMQEKLNQFDKNQVWELLPKPENAAIVGTKWLFRNKLNKDGKVVRNKARLVAQGYSQQEGVD
nr:uncharacterized protein LOC117280838 [Nicotiana tomentosiformis]